MPQRLLFTVRGNHLLTTLVLLVGIFLVIAIESPRTCTIIFLAATSFESLTFCLVYGLRTAWWREPAARAVFWAVLAYAGVSTVVLIGGYLRLDPYGWFDNLREMAYLGLVVAGLNLCLTLTRVLGRSMWSNHPR
jgi:hypothetical protein